MTAPAITVNLSASVHGTTGSIAVGDVLVPVSGVYVLATTANRADGGRSHGIALTAWGAASAGAVRMQSVGIADAAVTGLGAGTESWLRVSAFGRLERCTPGAGDDVVGRCFTDGTAHLTFGVFDSTNYTSTSSGGGGDSGRTVKAMADDDQTLTTDEATKLTIVTTGTNTAKRTLTITPPDEEDESFLRTILNTCAGESVVISVGTGPEIEIEAGAKALVACSPTGVQVVVDMPLDPRDFGCPWNGVDDDTPGLILLQQAIPSNRARATVVQLPKGEGYCADNLDIFRKLHMVGQGKAYQPNYVSPINGLRFAPLKGIIVHGATSGADVAAAGGAGDATDMRFDGVNLKGQTAIVSDAVGNFGHGLFQVDTSLDTWEQLPATVTKGSCILKSGVGGTAITVGSPVLEYLGDGHTRDTTHLVWFRCTTSGTKGDTKPTEMANGSGTGMADIGDTVAATGGTAEWTVESIPKDYVNGAAVYAGQRVFIPGDNAHVFICLDEGPGTTAAGEATTLAASMDGLDYDDGIGTLEVASTDGFPPFGIIRVVSDAGFQFVTYSSKDATNFFGCTRTGNLPILTGVVSIGGAVTGPYKCAPWGVPVMIHNHYMMQPAHRSEFYDVGAQVGGASIDAVLPQGTIYIDTTAAFGTGTAGFADAGELHIWTGAAYTTVAYTGRTDSSFTDCTGGTGTMSASAEIGQGAFWQEEHNGVVAILASWVTWESGNIYGGTNGAWWVSSNYKRGYSGGSHFFTIRESSVHFTGQCFKNTGNNSNGGETDHIQGHFIGAGRTNVDGPTQLNINPSTDVADWEDGRWGNGGDVIVDRLQGTTRHSNHYAEASGGTGYRNDVYSGYVPSGNSSAWEQIGIEAALSPVLIYPAIVKNPPHGVSNETSAIVFGTYSRNIGSRVALKNDDTKFLLSTFAPIDPSLPAAFRMQVSGETYPTDWHCSEDMTLWTAAWFVFGKGTTGGFVTEQSLAVPREGATLPGNHTLGGIRPPWVCQDYAFFGVDPSVPPHSLGFVSSLAAIGSYGQWFKAGSFLVNRAGTSSGDPIGWRCLADGTPGTWVAVFGGTGSTAMAIPSLDIDWTLSGVHTKTLAAGSNTFTFSNEASGMSITVRVTSDGGGSTVTWPSVLWSGGVAPTQTPTGVDVYTFIHDGSDIYGSAVQAFA